MKKLLEVCVDSLASARAAQAGGADRLEFCSALAVGGLCPYPELLRQIKAECSLPVRCLMRPRAGDFLYTKDEIDLLCAQIHTLRDTGADGFVIGALTPDGTLDKPAMAQLLDACGDMPVTLHRCIDVSRDLAETYRAAAALGIDTVRAGLMPGDKAEQLTLLQQSHRSTVFVGDGINDAPVLTRADIGIAMGAMGADAAIEAADVVLMDDDPMKIAKAIRISRKCIGIVYQNIVFALFIKFACLALGAIGVADMWAAIFADVGVMVLAVLNAIRALRVKNL